MTGEHRHLSDEVLLLYAEGELPPASTAQVKKRLAACADCRARLAQITNMLAEIGEAQKREHNSQLPSPDRARAALLARMAEVDSALRRSSWREWKVAPPARRGYALATLVLVAISLGAIYYREVKAGPQQGPAASELWSEPRSSLTPGTVLPVSKAQLCSVTAGTQAPVVPGALQRKVLAMYGIKDAPPNTYEVDYLITPQLGGATDIRNLWPEPYFDTEWNAHVKDQLEDRLYRMVCHGDVDLAIAQQDISRDWIAAYRKYFHTENPLANIPQDRL